jgi:hypothetical protein
VLDIDRVREVDRFGRADHVVTDASGPTADNSGWTVSGPRGLDQPWLTERP